MPLAVLQSTTRKLLFLWLLILAVPAEVRWKPASTYVLVASINTSPLHHDTGLVKQLVEAGVSDDNILFLKDKQATPSAIRKALVYVAAHTHPGDTLICYLQGRGDRQRFFAYGYDPAAADQTALSIDEIYPLLKRPLQAGHFFLIGDGCRLDGVLNQFETGRPEVRLAVLAAGGKGTFTQGLIRILAGDPLVDANHDSRISLEEAERFLHNQMKYREDQLANLCRSRSFEKDFGLRSTAGKAPKTLAGPYPIGDLLEARDAKDQWYPVEIVEGKGDRYKVRYNYWEEKIDEWVQADHLRPLVKAKLNVGQRCEVQWQEKWRPAIISKSVEDYFYLAHFENERGDGDEWITADRARPGQESAGTSFKPPLDLGPPASDQLVAAQWRNGWYRARIIGKVGGLYTVHYDDESSGQLSPSNLIPIAQDANIGDRVLAVRAKDGRMFAGRVVAIQNAQASIQWEDGRPDSTVPLDKVARLRP